MRILYLPNSYSQQRQFEKKNYNPYPVRMAMEAQKYRNEGHEVYWGKEGLIEGVINNNTEYILLGKGTIKTISPDKIITEPENLPFLSLPHPDRVFTRAKEYTSGNYKYLPGTHIMSASGCWWGKCSFCVENGKPYEVREVDDVIEEIKECKQLGFKEVFDDSATFPTGEWLEKFCKSLGRINIFSNRSISFGCNCRLVAADYSLMHSVGFRMVLFGLESANQKTLDIINKGRKVEDVRYIIKAAEAGLDCHGAFMFGYPWETDEDATRTLRLVHTLLRRGYLKTAQASFYNPKIGESNPSHRKFVRRIYEVAYSPQFWFNQIKDIKDKDDLKYLWRKIKAGLADTRSG
jgi:radical SAM superfamily enzyme YgiQ (UPF0313 family)